MPTKKMKKPAKCRLAYSNRPDCITFGLKQSAWSPWQWASNWVLHTAAPHRGERIIDLGCRDNPFIINHCLSRGIDLLLTDIQPLANHDQASTGINFAQVDLCQPLPFPDGSFDVVLSESAIEHLPPENQLTCIREAYRILAPNGRMSITLGYALGIERDLATQAALIHNDFFALRHCSLYRVSVDGILDTLGADHPSGCSLFPRFRGFSEARLLDRTDILLDDYSDISSVPDVANLRKVKVVELGISVRKNSGE